MEAGGVVKELQAALFPVCAKGQIKVQLKIHIGLVMQLSELGLPLSNKAVTLAVFRRQLNFFCIHHVK